MRQVRALGKEHRKTKNDCPVGRQRVAVKKELPNELSGIPNSPGIPVIRNKVIPKNREHTICWMNTQSDVSSDKQDGDKHERNGTS